VLPLEAARPRPAGRISPEEKLITLTEATRHLPKVHGKKVSVCTLGIFERALEPFPAALETYRELLRRGARAAAAR
jgi:hypothetical protein